MALLLSIYSTLLQPDYLCRVRYWLALLLFVFYLCPQAHSDDEIEIRFVPAKPKVGTTNYLEVIYTGIMEPDVVQLPTVKDLEWKGVSREIRRNSDGHEQNVARYSFEIQAMNRLRVPELQIRVGPHTSLVPAQFVAVDGGDSGVDFSPYIYGEVGLENGTSLVAGEIVKTWVKVYYRKGLQIKRMSVKRMILENMRLVKQGDSYLGEEVERDGKPYLVGVFPVVLQSLGKAASVGCELDVTVSVAYKRGSRQRELDTRMFSGYKDPFAQYEERSIELVSPLVTLSVEPLPQADDIYCGLIGEWSVQSEFSGSFVVGDTSSLLLTVTGKGNSSDFVVPKLSGDKMRFFEPEVAIDERGTDAEIRVQYLIVPLEPGERTLGLAMSTYSVSGKRYVRHQVEQSVLVTGSSLMLNSDAPVREILPVKAAEGTMVFVPLRENVWSKLWWLMILSGVIICSKTLSDRRQLLREGGSAYRRLCARRSLRRLCRENNLGVDIVQAEFVCAEIKQLVCDVLELPHSTTISELRPQLGKELAAMMEHCESQLYAGLNSEERRAAEDEKEWSIQVSGVALRKCLKKFLAVSMLAFIVFPLWAESEAKELDLGKGAYWSGGGLDPINEYNTGCRAFESGDLAGSLVHFERARKLLPRDRDIYENLLVVRKKLACDEEESIFSPLFYARDLLRPDEWCGAAAVMFLLGVGLFWRGRFAASVVFGSAVFVSSGVAVWQLHSSYDASSVLVVNGARIKSLPSSESMDGTVVLPVGTMVKVMEQRGSWIKVAEGNRKGWIKLSSIESVIPPF